VTVRDIRVVDDEAVAGIIHAGDQSVFFVEPRSRWDGSPAADPGWLFAVRRGRDPRAGARARRIAAWEYTQIMDSFWVGDRFDEDGPIRERIREAFVGEADPQLRWRYTEAGRRWHKAHRDHVALVQRAVATVQLRNPDRPSLRRWVAEAWALEPDGPEDD
jgi:hypothetical protein